MLCSLKYRNLSPLRYRDKTQTLYSSHTLAINALLRHKPATVLDIGCGPGFVARAVEQRGATVTGVDAFEPLPAMMSGFHRVDLDREPVPLDMFDFDAVLMLDVIEHLAEPEQFLLGLRNRSTPTPQIRPAPVLILTTPNVAFAAIRFNLLCGRFNYAERGILDITHKRLFTKHSLKRCLYESGYDIQSLTGIGPPFETVMGGGVISKLLGWTTTLAARIWPTMFAFQFLLVAKPRPGVGQLLAQAVDHRDPPDTDDSPALGR
jgi:2-polyprenyl-3-methyl-5-hydroxy-6-metoxy-1,4-benzoquinol methylase